MYKYVKPVAIGAASLVATYYIIEHGKHKAHQNDMFGSDPDPTLRLQEKDVLIPNLMRKQAKAVDCLAQTEEFHKCCHKVHEKNKYSFSVVSQCKLENQQMLDCMNEKFLDREYYLKCKQLYKDDKYLRLTTGVDENNRNIIKKCIKEEEKRTFAFDEFTEPYFIGVKKLFIETNNIDAYDESVLAARDEKLQVK